MFPPSGDLVFFDWKNDGSIDHVGIVESVVDGTIYTIEGNSGDKVARRSYPIGYGQIVGYGGSDILIERQKKSRDFLPFLLPYIMALRRVYSLSIYYLY